MRNHVVSCHTEFHEPSGEWVLYLKATNGNMCGIGALNGEIEAKAVQSILQGALELHYSVLSKCKPIDSEPRELYGPWMRGMKNADMLVEGEKLIDIVLN